MLALAAAGALAASYTDLKRGIVPNRLSFSLFLSGVAGNIAVALLEGDPSLAVDLLLAVLATFAVGYALWLLGGLGAGDVKEFLFLAALLPRYPEPLLRHFSPALAPYPFPLSILINTFLLLFPFLYLYALLHALRRVPLRTLLEPLLSPGDRLTTALYLTGVYSLTPLIGSLPGFVLALSGLLLLRQGARRLAAGALLILLAAAVAGAHPTELFRYYLLIAAIILLFSLFWNSLGVLRAALTREVKITSLQEGMIPAEEIYIRNGEVIREERGFIEKIKEYAGSGAMKRGTLIAGTSAAGITERQIATLCRLVEEGRLEDRIKVKERMPFAPAIFLGLLAALVFGDLAWMVRR